MRTRTGLTILQRRLDEVQIGLDPRWAVRLAGLTSAETSLLSSLASGADAPLRSLAHAYGVPLARVVELQSALADAGLLAPPADHRNSTARPPLPGRLSDDVALWSRLSEDDDGGRVVAARFHRAVRVCGLGRTGVVVAATLAAAGVGAVLPVDGRPVSHRDLGVAGLRTGDLGRPRERAVARVVHEIGPEVRIHGTRDERVDIEVRVDDFAVDLRSVRGVWAHANALLSVVVREADVVVGPLVRPRRGPCLRCLDLHRSDVDRDWPLLAAQLVSVAEREPAPQESVLAQVAGGIAAGQVLAVLDGRQPTTAGASLEVRLPDLVPRIRRWPAHPDCGCTGHRDAVPPTAPPAMPPA